MMEITEEQWAEVEWQLLCKGIVARPAIQASRDFIAGIKQLQANAGKASEQLPGLQSAILDMAKQEE